MLFFSLYLSFVSIDLPFQVSTIVLFSRENLEKMSLRRFTTELVRFR